MGDYDPISKHTRGSWGAFEDDPGECNIVAFASDKSRPFITLICRIYTGGKKSSDAQLIEAAPDLYDMVYALTHGWTVETKSMYDEEGTEGWVWTEPNGTEHCETGDWNEMPPWPDSARKAIAKSGAK